MKRICVILLSFLCSLQLVAAEPELSNIQSAFLDVGFGARALGMGGAYTALTDNAASILWNPAGLVNINGTHSLTLDRVNILNLYSYNFLGYGYKINDLMAAGGGVVHSGDDAMSELTFYVSGAMDVRDYVKEMIPRTGFINSLNIGGNIKYYHTSFGDNSDGALEYNGVQYQNKGSGNGFGLDLGIKGQIFGKHLCALLWRTPLNSISWETSRSKGSYSEGLPASLVFGYSSSKDDFVWSLDWDKALHSDQQDFVRTGLEYNLKLFETGIAIRGGYGQELFTSENKKYSLGTGFHFDIPGNYQANIDLAYQFQTQWASENNTLRISADLLK